MARPNPLLPGRLFYLGVLLVALFTGAAAFFFQRAELNQEKLRIASADHAVRLEFNAGLARVSESLTLLATALAADSRLQSAMASGDAETLRRDWTETHARLSENHPLARFAFLGPDFNHLLRLHRPERHGDTADRTTLAKAARTLAPASGLEPGTRGQPTLRLVHPVLHENQLAGYLELGFTLDSLLDLIATESRVKLALRLDKAVIDRDRWLAAPPALSRPEDWDKHPARVLALATADTRPALDAYELQAQPPPPTRPSSSTDRKISAGAPPPSLSSTPPTAPSATC